MNGRLDLRLEESEKHGLLWVWEEKRGSLCTIRDVAKP